METLLKADIFFFITALAVLFVTVLLGVALVYTIKILRNVNHVARRAKEESEGLFTDLADLRSFVRERGKKASAIEEIVRGVKDLLPKRKRTAKANAKNKEKAE